MKPNPEGGNDMKYYLVYDVANDSFISNVVCGTRTMANKWCDMLEKSRGTEFLPVMFVDGVQVTRV